MQARNRNYKIVTAAASVTYPSGTVCHLGPKEWAEYQATANYRRAIASGATVEIGPRQVEIHKMATIR